MFLIAKLPLVTASPLRQEADAGGNRSCVCSRKRKMKKELIYKEKKLTGRRGASLRGAVASTRIVITGISTAAGELESESQDQLGALLDLPGRREDGCVFVCVKFQTRLCEAHKNGASTTKNQEGEKQNVCAKVRQALKEFQRLLICRKMNETAKVPACSLSPGPRCASRFVAPLCFERALRRR